MFHDHGVYPWTMENLALLREAESRNGDATETYGRAVAELERIFGFPSYETAEALYHQSGYFLRVGDLGAAEKAIGRAISVMDENREAFRLRKIRLPRNTRFGIGGGWA